MTPQNTPMRVLSLFSGVGGFDIGLEAAGMKTVFQCELDKQCQSVLQYHWPNIPKWDDVTTLTGEHILETVGGIDLVAWGSPCQDLSVAGRRAGLTGEHSGLFHEGIRIIKELRELSNGKYPKWSIWENVYGALSSNGGADFGQVLYEMDEAGACFSEWAVLDAKYFGVPQRRRRVFIATCFDSATSERCPSPLFPVRKVLFGNFAESKGAKKNASETAGNSAETDNKPITRTTSDTVGALAARDFKGVGNQYVSEHKLIIEPDMNMSIRRLTPIEHERLMGWPDNHTLIGVGGQIADTHRYKMCGNGVVSSVAEWIARQIIKI